MVSDVEVHTLNPKVQGPTNPGRTTRVFNAGLALIDPRDGVHPYMAEALRRGSSSVPSTSDSRSSWISEFAAPSHTASIGPP